MSSSGQAFAIGECVPTAWVMAEFTPQWLKLHDQVADIAVLAPTVPSKGSHWAGQTQPLSVARQEAGQEERAMSKPDTPSLGTRLADEFHNTTQIVAESLLRDGEASEFWPWSFTKETDAKVSTAILVRENETD